MSCIAQGARLLMETVQCFGTKLESDQKYYRGVSTAYMFKNMKMRFNLPMSTSVSVRIIMLLEFSQHALWQNLQAVSCHDSSTVNHHGRDSKQCIDSTCQVSLPKSTEVARAESSELYIYIYIYISSQRNCVYRRILLVENVRKELKGCILLVWYVALIAI